MSKQSERPLQLPVGRRWLSKYQSNLIPHGAEAFVSVDHGAPDGDYTVRGFYDPKTGECHIQEVSPNAD